MRCKIGKIVIWVVRKSRMGLTRLTSVGKATFFLEVPGKNLFLHLFWLLLRGACIPWLLAPSTLLSPSLTWLSCPDFSLWGLLSLHWAHPNNPRMSLSHEFFNESHLQSPFYLLGQYIHRFQGLGWGHMLGVIPSPLSPPKLSLLGAPQLVVDTFFLLSLLALPLLPCLCLKFFLMTGSYLSLCL